VKFLGVIFDRKLSWNEHINYIIDRCNKRINLLRALTGTDWGANKKTLIMLYRSLIRSIIDYGAIAYDSASESSKRRLDQIQSKALRICCGAMIMTPVAALQVECGEMPLELRRKEQQLQYATKLEASHDNPTRSILIDCWQNHKKYPKGKEPFMVKTRDMHQIVQTTGEIILGNKQQIRPPWINGHTTEMNENSITTNNDIILATNGVESPDIHRILNDATKHDKVSAVNNPMNHEYNRLINNAVNLDANRIMNLVMNRDDDNRRRSDNMSHDTSLRTNDVVNHDVILGIDDNPEMNSATDQNATWGSNDDTNPGAIRGRNHDTIQKMNDAVSQDATWRINDMNRHAIRGVNNNHRDVVRGTSDAVNQQFMRELNKVASHDVNRIDDTQTTNEPMEVLQQNSGNITTIEAKRKISEHIDSIWQHQWNESTKGNDYKKIEPLVSRKLKLTQLNRGREVIATRLRLGKCSLNF